MADDFIEQFKKRVGYTPPPDTNNDDAELARIIKKGADLLGIDPEDYATAMSYESAGTFDTWKKGPVTKWGQHRGTIQYGEPQQREFGVYKGQSFEDQVTNSNVKYLKQRGVKPGMKFPQIYAAINGGNVNKNLATQDWDTGRTIADNIKRADNDHRPGVQKRFKRYWESAASEPVNTRSQFEALLGPMGGAKSAGLQPTKLTTPPAPEHPDTLAAQRRAAADPKSSRVGVLYTPGTQLPELLDGEIDLPLPDGGLLRVNEAKLDTLSRTKQRNYAEEIMKGGDYTDLIGGKVESHPDTTGKPAVVTRDARTKRELVASAVTDPQNIEAEIASQKAQFPGTPTIATVEPAAQVVAERNAGMESAEPVEVPNQFPFTVYDVDPSLTPEIADKGEAVFRQAANQFARDAFGRDLNEIELQALVEEQRKAAGGFTFGRFADEATGKFVPLDVDEATKYHFTSEDANRIYKMVEAIQPMVQNVQAKELSRIIASGMPLDPDTFAQLMKLGITPEQATSAYTSDPLYEVARNQGAATKKFYEGRLAEYGSDPSRSPLLAQLMAYRDIGVVPNEKVEAYAAQEQKLADEERQAIANRKYSKAAFGDIPEIAQWLKDNWSSAELVGEDIGELLFGKNSAGLLPALWMDAPEEFRLKSFDPAEREKARKAAVESRIQTLQKQFGSLQEFKRYMAAQEETAGRHAENFGRSILHLAGSIPKTISNLDAVNEKLNPLGIAIPKDYMPSLRSAGNLLRYLGTSLTGEKYDFETADLPVDKRKMYALGEYVSKLMGEDPFMNESRWGWASSGLGSGVGFLVGGHLLRGTKYGAGVLGALTQIGSTYDDLKKAGVPEETAQLGGIALGGPLGWSEKWGLGGAAERALANLGADVSEEAVRTLLDSMVRFAKTVGKQTGEGILRETPEEFLQEWGQSTFSAAAIKAIAAKDKTSAEKIQAFFKDLPKQAIANLPQGLQGGAVGGLLGGGTNTLVGGINAARSYTAPTFGKALPGLEDDPITPTVQAPASIPFDEVSQYIPAAETRSQMEQLLGNPSETTTTATGKPLGKNEPIAAGTPVMVKGEGEGVIVADLGNSVVVDTNPTTDKTGEVKYNSRTVARKDRVTPTEVAPIETETTVETASIEETPAVPSKPFKVQGVTLADKTAEVTEEETVEKPAIITEPGKFADSLGVRRADMPQIASADYGEFTTFAKDRGVEIQKETVKAKTLKPTQRSYNPEHADTLPDAALDKPLTVSKDNRVLDGHNRLVRLLENGERDVQINRIPLNAQEALDLMKEFPKTTYKTLADVGKAAGKPAASSQPEQTATTTPTETESDKAVEDYVKQALENLRNTSRTAKGVVDTSSVPGKADQMTGVTGDEAANLKINNFEAAVRSLHSILSAPGSSVFKGRASYQAEDIKTLALDMFEKVNKGIVKEGVVERTQDSDKYGYTRVKDLPAAFDQFAEEFAKRLAKGDPIETAAWVEWRTNLRDHFWADGVGATSKLLAMVPLIKAGLPLPKYPANNKGFFEFSPKEPTTPDANGKAYLTKDWEAFLEFYRSLFSTSEKAVEKPAKVGQVVVAKPDTGITENPLSPADKKRLQAISNELVGLSGAMTNALDAGVSSVKPIMDKMQELTDEEAKIRGYYETAGQRKPYVEKPATEQAPADDEPTLTFAEKNGRTKATIKYDGFTVSATLQPLTGSAMERQKAVLERLGADPGKFIQEYREKYPKVLNPDEAKTLFEEFNVDPLGATQFVHTASSLLSKLIWKTLMRDLPAGQRITFLAGGAASGKTTNARKITDAADLVVDRTMSDAAENRQMLEEVIAKGHIPMAVFVHRNVREAAKFMLQRWTQEGRVIPIDVFAQGHFEAANAFIKDTWQLFQESLGQLIANRSFPRAKDGVQIFTAITDKPPVQISIDELESLAYDNLEEVKRVVRDTLIPLYENNRDIFTDERILDVLEGRSVEYRPDGVLPAGKQGDSTGRGGVSERDERAGSESAPAQEVTDGTEQRTGISRKPRIESDRILETELPDVSQELGEPGADSSDGDGAPASVREDVQRPDRSGSESTGSTPDSGQRDDIPASGGSGSKLDGQRPTTEKPGNAGDVKRVVGTTGNYYVDDVEAFAAGGLKQKFRANVTALETLRTIQAEGRTTATPEEQAKLAKYMGWGQFSALFNIYNEKGEAWQKEREELLRLITPEEFESASASTKNAHYTAPQVVRTVWDIIEKIGFKGGNVLETSLGVGNFLYLMPPALRGTSRVTGIELDQLTAQIAKLLFPTYDIRQMGYQEFQPPKGFYDLAISNVPFGPYKVNDPHMPYFLKSKIHNYFFAKSLENVRPGGLIAFITSTGTMTTPDVLEYLNGRADLVAAVRFPGNTFLKEAGTSVVTDLVILRVKNPQAVENAKAELERVRGYIEGVQEALKHPENFTGEEGAIRQARFELQAAEYADELKRLNDLIRNAERFTDDTWTKVVEVPDPDGGDPIPLNKYYADNPDMILGRLDRSGTMYRGNSVNVARTPDFEDLVTKAIDTIARTAKNAVLPRESAVAEPTALPPAPESMQQGALTVKDGKVYTREGSFLKEQPMTSKQIKAVEGALKIREALDAVTTAERSGDVKTADENRQALNKAYDAFIKDFGTIHDNRKLFEVDPSHYKLLALENFDKKTKKVTGKASIFTEPTVSALARPKSAANYGDAISISLNQSGIVDVPMIAELLKVTPEEAAQELVTQNLAYNDPRDGWTVRDLYLSGEVRRKLREAREAATINPEFQPNVNALEAVQPADVSYRKIEPTLGAVWIPPSDIAQFMADAMIEAGQSAEANDFLVQRLGTGDWVVGFRDVNLRNSAAATSVLGTEDRHFAEIVSAAIRDMPIVIRRTVGKESFVDRKASLRAQKKVAAVKKKFRKWVWADDARRERLHRAYNDTYNDTTQTTWDGSHLTFPGMNPVWQQMLRPHLKNAVYRILNQGRLLAAHEVGTGKTNIMIAAAMELRRLGLAKKPAIICLNANIEQVAEAARDLYPGAKVLAAYHGMDANTRQQTATRIMSGDWDMVILTHENLTKLPMSRERQVAFIKEEVQYLRDQIKAVEAEENAIANPNEYSYRRPKKSDNRVVKALEAKIANREAKLKELFSKPRDKAITFEETGIDFLMVDEAHAFKNLEIATTRQGTKGIPTSDAQRATNMFLVTRYLAEKHNGRGTAFFTGTPISNTTAEAFNIMRYLMFHDLKSRGLEHFDSWAANYGENIETQEMSASGELKPVTAFRRFKNLDTLTSLLNQVMDVVFAEDVGQLVRPKRVDEIIPVPMSDAQKAYMETLKARAEALKHMSRSERMEKGADNWLALGTHAKWMAIDMRLVDPNAADDPGSKTNEMVRQVLKIQKDNPGKTQLIFSNVGVNPTKMNPSFRLYGDIIQKLVDGGIPRNKIIDFSKFKSGGKGVNDETDDGDSPAKEEAMRRLNAGEAWIAIGSTEKLGTGVNVQNKVVAMHKLDVKQRPDQDEQETGRGWRHGNENKEVMLKRYTTQDSFDMFFYDRLKQKKAFIDQLLRGELSGEFVDSIDDSLDYDTVVAVTASNPYIRERIDILRDLRGLENDYEGYQEDRLRLRDRELMTLNQIKRNEGTIDDIREDRAAAIEKADDVVVTIGSDSFVIEDPADVRKHVTELAKIREDVQADLFGTKVLKEAEEYEQLNNEIRRRISAQPKFEYEKANEALQDAIAAKVSTFGYGREAIIKDFATMFGFPVDLDIRRDWKSKTTVGVPFLRLPSGASRKLSHMQPVTDARQELTRARAATTTRYEEEIASLQAELPRIKTAQAQTFDELPRLEELRKRLVQVEMELTGEVIPEGYISVGERIGELRTPEIFDKAEEDAGGAPEWTAAKVGDQFTTSTGRLLLVSNDEGQLPEAEATAGEYRSEQIGKIIADAQTWINENIGKAGAYIDPIIVDIDSDQVIFTDETQLSAVDVARITKIEPKPQFMRDGNEVYAVSPAGEVVAITVTKPNRGVLSEDMAAAVRIAKYRGDQEREKNADAQKAANARSLEEIDADLAKFDEAAAALDENAADWEEQYNALKPQYNYDELIAERNDAAKREPGALKSVADINNSPTMDELRALPFEPFDNLLTGDDAADVQQTNFDRGVIKASPKGIERFRRMFEEARIRSGQTRRGADDAEDLFGGVFLDPDAVQRTVALYNETIKKAESLGYSQPEIDVLRNDVETLRKAASALPDNRNTVIIYILNTALPHELFRRASYLGLMADTVFNQHPADYNDILDNDPVTDIVWKNHFSKYAEYTRPSGSTRRALLRASIPQYLLGLSDEQMAEMGITKEMRASYLLTWWEGYAKKNGIESLDHFDNIWSEADEILNQIRTAYAAENAERNGQVREVDEADNRRQRPPSGERTGDGQGDRSAPSRPLNDTPEGMVPVTYPADAGDYFHLNEGEKFASLPSTLRLAGLDADDVVYQIFGDRAAQASAVRMLEENGIEGSLQILRNVRDPDVDHAILSFMIQRAYYNLAAALEQTDPNRAFEAREFARKIGREHALKAVAAGRFTRAASIVAHTVEGMMYVVEQVVEDTYGRDYTLSPRRWAAIQAMAQKAEENMALVDGLNKDKKRLEALVKRLEKMKAGTKSRRSASSQASRRKLVTMVKEATQPAVDEARARLLARFGGALKSVIAPMKEQRLAPNGKPSNLNEFQWKQVRTPEFKEFFGDWENDSENASQVVDENGEPLVVFHGTDHGDIDAFDTSSEWTEGASFFSDDVETANYFATKDVSWNPDNWDRSMEEPTVYPVFLNIRKPKTGVADDGDFDVIDTEVPIATAKKEGHDGMIISGVDEAGSGIDATTYVAFEPTQIKSAIGNRGTFDRADPSILKSVIDPPPISGLTKQELTDFATVGADMLVTGLAGEKDYLPEDFYADMKALFGDVVEPQFDEIYRWSMALRDTNLDNARKERTKNQIQNRYDHELEDWEIEEIIESEQAQARRRRRIEMLHREQADSPAPPRKTKNDPREDRDVLGRIEELRKNRKPEVDKNVDLRRFIAQAAPDEETAVAAYLNLERQMTPDAFYKRLQELDIEDSGITGKPKAYDAAAGPGRRYRELFREGKRVLEEAKKLRQREIDAIDQGISEALGKLGNVRDLEFKARQDARESNRQMAEELKRIKSGELKHIAGEIWSFTHVFRTIMASGDLSGSWRQGGFFSMGDLGGGFYDVFANWIRDEENQKQTGLSRLKTTHAAMFRSFTQKGFGRAMMQLEDAARFTQSQRAGMDYAIAGKSEKTQDGEELFKGKEALDRLPGIGWLIEKGLTGWSERTYSGFLDTQRYVLYDFFANELDAQGMTFENNKPAYQAIAKFVNVATGRGMVPKNLFGKILVELPLFAPRYTMSRFQLLNMTLNPVAYANMPAGARKIVLRSAVRYYGTVGAILGILSGFGFVDWDWDDPEFAKVKMGSTKIDMWSGELQPVRLVLRLITAALRGDRVPGEMGYTMKNELTRFVRSKLSPVFSLLWDRVAGKDFNGNEFSWGSGIASRLVPLTIRDTYEAVKLDGKAGFATVPFVALGFGTSSYPDRPERPESAAEKLAAKVVAMKMDARPKTAQTPEEKAAYDLAAKLTARSRKGEDLTAEVDELVKAGKLFEHQRDSILAARTKSYLEDKAEGLSLDEYESVLREMTPEERQRMYPVSATKLKNAQVDGKLKQDQRERFETLGVQPVGYVPMPDDVREEMKRFKIGEPDVGQSLTLRKGQDRTKLTFEQYDKYRKESLERIYAAVQQRINSDAYQKANSFAQEKMIRSAINKARMRETKETKGELIREQ